MDKNLRKLSEIIYDTEITWLQKNDIEWDMRITYNEDLLTGIGEEDV